MANSALVKPLGRLLSREPPTLNVLLDLRREHDAGGRSRQGQKCCGRVRTMRGEQEVAI